MSKRISILERIMEEDNIYKKAQEIISQTENQEVDKATADRMANELAENIIDQIYQSVLNELQV